MVNCIAICGDSFATGMGIDIDPDIMYEKSFGSLVSKHIGVNYKNYARAGCCNFVINLQVQKIIQQKKENLFSPFVLITTTHHSRFSFPLENDIGIVSYDLADVDYAIHNVFGSKEELTQRLPFTLNEKPRLTSDTVGNWLKYRKNKNEKLRRNFQNIENKLLSVESYFEHLYSDIIKRDYDLALICKMHIDLNNANLPHIIMSGEKHLGNYIGKENFLYNDWGYYSQKYPDGVGSGHCSYQGHIEVANRVLEKLNTNRLLYQLDDRHL